MHWSITSRFSSFIFDMESIIISIYSIKMIFRLFFIYFIVLASANVIHGGIQGRLNLWVSWSEVKSRPLIGSPIARLLFWRLSSSTRSRQESAPRASTRWHVGRDLWTHMRFTNFITGFEPSRLGSFWIPKGPVWSINACIRKFQNNTSWIKNKLLSWSLLTQAVK